MRIDFGFTPKEIASMANDGDFKIQINASTVTEKFLKDLYIYEINYDNLDALHNFYPRKWTGLSENFVKHKNDILLSRGIKIGAFVGSKNRRRGPLKEGLITLENHRNLDCEIAANHLIALKNVYTSREDESEYVIRACESREALSKFNIKPQNTVYKNVGDITLDNKKYLRYAGEIHIVKVGHESDERTNVVGSILQDDLYLLNYIQGGRKFYFDVV